MGGGGGRRYITFSGNLTGTMEVLVKTFRADSNFIKNSEECFVSRCYYPIQNVHTEEIYGLLVRM